MSVEDFIKELQKYPNQKADLNFIVNINNSEDDTYDIENCEVACFQQDFEDGTEYYKHLIEFRANQIEISTSSNKKIKLFKIC